MSARRAPRRGWGPLGYLAARTGALGAAGMGMMKHIVVVVAMLAWPLVAAAEPSRGPGVVERSRLEVQPGGRAIKKLAIENPLGNVRVEGYDGTAIQIETLKHAPDDDGLDRLRVSLVPNQDGTVRITTTADASPESTPLARGAVRIDLIIRAPRDARIDAAASAGSLEVVNMDAGGELDTSSGPISVRNVSGEVMTHSVSGMTSLAQVFGSVDAQTISSDVELDTIGGERLVASANRGKIAGRRVRSRDVELTTTDGKIMLEAEAALRGHVVVASLRGDIDVRLRRNGAIRVRARGTRVMLGAPAQTGPEGWVEAQIGQAAGRASPSTIEMRSAYGVVKFALIQ